MKYRTFEELPVWRAALDLAVRVHALAQKGAFRTVAGLRDQIERAAVSISNNIAEGFERGTHDELIAFLYIAKGSTGEVRSMLHFLGRLSEMEVNSASIRELTNASLDITRQLNGWLASLKDGNQLGPRHKSTATRAAGEAELRRLAFLDYEASSRGRPKFPRKPASSGVSPMNHQP